MNVGFISLGCAKNKVDSEEILSYLVRNGFEVVSDPELSDIIIVNTCGFIEASKKEAIDTILEMLTYKKVTVAIGCLVERYYDDLVKEIPEVDLFVPIRDYYRFGELFQKVVKDKTLEGKIDPTKRVYSTPDYQAYLRISEGCNNCCTYCAIPLIRGHFRSIPLETLKVEMDELDRKGIKELVVISQDTTRYGSDLVGQNINTCTLLREALKHESFDYIRLLYLYPDEITDELIELIGSEKRLTPYFDIPIQHSVDHVLADMHRRGNHDFLVNLFKKIREKVPHAILRTTLIVGFPGETEEDFNELLAFVKETKFDHLGVFTYSPEEGTIGATLPNQVPERTKKKRLNQIMKAQAAISFKANQQRIGEVIDVTITGYDSENYCYEGMCYIFAPDDIDGKLYIFSDDELEIGKSYKAEIINASAYDLDCKVIHE